MTLLWPDRTREDERADDGLVLASILVLARSRGLLRGLGRAVEIGCGTGERARVLAPYFDEYLALDRDEVAIRRALGVRPRGGLRFAVGDDLPEDDGSFDLVVRDFAAGGTPAGTLRSLTALTRRLTPTGIAFFELPRRRGGPRWPAVAAAVRSTGGRVVWIGRLHDRRVVCVARRPPSDLRAGTPSLSRLLATVDNG